MYYRKVVRLEACVAVELHVCSLQDAHNLFQWALEAVELLYCPCRGYLYGIRYSKACGRQYL